MAFSSSEFLFLFLPAVLIFYFLPVRNMTYKNAVLLVFSLLFYAWGEPVYVFGLVLLSFIDWLLAGRLKQGRKGLLAFTAILNLAILFVFKYLNFITGDIASLTSNAGIQTHVSMPLGISFIIFQLLSYVFDVYRGRIEHDQNFFHVLLYVTLFPQLIEGPIVRYETVQKEMHDRHVDMQSFSTGMCRFIRGLARKVLVADVLGMLADTVYGYDASLLSTAGAWLGSVGYMLQIYFDFAGYSDMALGLASMFGFTLEENFRYPYQSHSVSEFWRRWHISMGTWFRDYVYFPLGGSRVKKNRMILNLLAVWVLTGIWHGADWTFLLWGLLHFCALAVEKLTGMDKGKGFLNVLWTLFFVNLGWVFFRADSVHSAFTYLQAMFFHAKAGMATAGALDLFHQYCWILFIGIAVCASEGRGFFQKNTKGNNALFVVVHLLLALLSIAAVVKEGNDPFIYASF